MTDIQIRQGEDSGYEWPVLGADDLPLDLTGYSARAQIRTKGNTLLHTFSTTDGNILLALGSVLLIWTSAQTVSWRWRGGYYDLELVNSQGKVMRLDSGYVEVLPEVTQ